jgi:hypothetical protein
MFIWQRLSSLRNRALFMMALPILSLVAMFTPFFSSDVSAVTAADLQKKAEVWIALRGMIDWPEDLERNLSASRVNSCDFLESQNSIHGPRLSSGNLASIGMTCGDIAKALGYKPPSGSQSNYTIPDRWNKDQVLSSLSAAGISSASMFYGGNLRTGEPSGAIGYAIAYNFLVKNCSITYKTEFVSPTPAYNEDPAHNQRVDWIKEGGTRETPLNDDSADEAEDYLFWMWTYRDGKAIKGIFHAGAHMDDFYEIGSGANFVIDYQTGPRDATEPWQLDCYQAARLLQDQDRFAKDYANVLKPGGPVSAGTCADKYGGNEGLLAACDAGFKNKGTPNYCQNNFSPSGQKTLYDACVYGATTATGDSSSTTPPPSGDTGDGGAEEDDPTTCAITGIGWIICPVLNFMAEVTDGAYAFIERFLQVQPLLLTGETEGMYKAWEVMRNFANVVFVIAFLIIIFSQITSLGITNYGIKKMLPRLIVAAILVNTSYWICAIAVDVSNIAGGTLTGLFNSIGASIDIGVKSDWSTGNGWQGIVGAILVSGVIGGGLLYIGLAALVPVLTASLVAVLFIFIILIIRQILIILLIVISPLAFVAYLLPNTERLFTQWRNLLQGLLIAYPIISLIFGASALASIIISAGAQ